MKLPIFTNCVAIFSYPSARTNAFFAAITALFFVGATDQANAQFTFASDNAADSVYGSGSGGWEQGDDGGFGFGGWGFTTGANTGSFIGNPNNNGIANTDMGSTAFGMFSTSNNGAYANRSRGFDVGMGIGDSFTFDWGINWDAGSGAKGFDLKAGSTNIFTIINGGSAAITFSNRLDSSSGTASATYGTNNMAVTLTRTATGYTFTMTSRNTGGLFTTNITTTATIDNFNFFIGSQSDNNGNRNMYFDNLSITNSGVFSQGGSVTNANRFTGAGNLSVGNSTTLALSGAGNNDYTGTTIISNSSTLRFQGAGTSDFASAISGGGSLVMSNSGGVLNLSGNNSGFTGTINIAAGILEARNVNALGTAAGNTTVANGATLKIFTNATGFTLAENINISGVGVGSAGAINNTGGDNTLSGGITLSGNSRINADTTGSSGSLTISGSIGGGNHVLFVGALGATSPTTGGNVIISGAVSGNGGAQDGTTASLYKDGVGALTLSAANTHAGATLLNNGTILIGNNAAFGTGTLQIHFNNFDATKVLASTDGTTRTLSNAMNIFGSNLSLGATDRAGSLIFNGSVNLGNDTTGDNQRTITTAAGTSHTFGGVVSGNTSNLLIKGGTGTLTLNGNNTFNAGLQLNDGTILVGNNNALGTGTFQVQFDVGGTKTLASSSASSFTLGNNVNIFNSLTIGRSGDANGSLTLSGNVFLGNEVDANRTLTLVGNHAISGIVSGQRGIVKQGAGQLTLSGNNTFTGNIFIDDGTINLDGGTLGAGAIEIGAGSGGSAAASLKVSSGTFSRAITVNSDVGAGNRSIEFANTTGTATLSGGITLEKTAAVSTASGGTGVLSGTIGGTGAGLTVSGAGRLTLSGNNTFNGGVSLGGTGFLRLNSTTAAGSGSITQSSGTSTLEINTTGTVANAMSLYNISTLQTVTLSGNKTLNNATYTVLESTTTTESGNLSGEGGITKEGAGTLLVTGNNTYTGAVAVNAGVLNLNSSVGGGAANTSAVSVASGATLLISQSNQVNNSAAVTLSGGTIQRASGVSEVFGNLNLTAASFLNFSGGTGGTIEFSGLDYTPSSLAALQLFNFTQGNTLIIRNTSNWASEINSGFTFGGDGGFGNSTFSDGTFTITAIPEPSTYVAAAGLLAMFLWPVRRRLIKDAKSILGLRAPARDRLEAYRNA